MDSPGKLTERIFHWQIHVLCENPQLKLTEALLSVRVKLNAVHVPFV
jgi:hypothetical protein